MAKCLHVRSPQHLFLAETHDKLGWDNFVEGRVVTTFLQFVEDRQGPARTGTSGGKWGSTLVTMLLTATHKQWLYRNIHVHHKKTDELTISQHETLFAKVTEPQNTDPSELLETHIHLFEENFKELGEGPAGGRQVWIALMESAKATKKHVVGGGRVFKDIRRRRGESMVYRRSF